METIRLAFSDPALLLEQYPLLLPLGLFFLSGLFAVLGAVLLIGERSAARERLHASAPAMATAGGRGSPESLRFEGESRGWFSFLQPLYEPFLPKDEETLTEMRKQMIQAGYHHPHAATRYYALRTVLAAALGAGILFLGPILVPSVPVNFYFIGAVMGVVVGYLLPAVLLDRRIATRKRLIREGFPDALDMLLVCMEAGLGLDAALARVGSEIRTAHPVISEHFRLVGNELRAGRSRQEALRNLAERTGVEEVRSLVSLLIQSDELGTSIAQALRVHAFEMRAARILRAEELAHKVPVKLAFPLMLGFIPVVVLATVTPAALRMVTFIFPILKSSPMSDLQ